MEGRKLSKAQQKKLALKERLQRDEENKRKEEQLKLQTDSVFTQHLVEEILIHGEKF